MAREATRTFLAETFVPADFRDELGKPHPSLPGMRAVGVSADRAMVARTRLENGKLAAWGGIGWRVVITYEDAGDGG